MSTMQRTLLVFAACGAAWLTAAPASAQTSWAGETFLSDYGRLQPVADAAGRDYAYLAISGEELAGRYRAVMLDAPEVFFSPESPYRGAKPEDIAAISGLVRSSVATALEQRGYALVSAPAGNVLYARVAVTGLRVQKKPRNLLGYTPVGFVVSTGMKALQDFTDKFDVLDLSLQVEVQDSTTGAVLGAAAMQRGVSADAAKPLRFDALVAASTELGERFACRLDNGYVEPARRIDCSDAAARRARPPVISP